MVVAVALSLSFSGLDSVPDIVSALAGGAAGFVLFLLIYLFSRGGMGEGDVKMAALAGLAVGWPLVSEAAVISFIIGGATAVIILFANKNAGRKTALPYGPFLAAGMLITLLFGQAIWNWYLALFGR